MHNNEMMSFVSGTVTSQVGEDLEKAIDQREFSDVAFIAEGKPIYAHRCIIAARCPFLDSLVEKAAGKRKEAEGGSEKGEKEELYSEPPSLTEVPLEGTSYEAFLDVIWWLYTSRRCNKSAQGGLRSSKDSIELAKTFRMLMDTYGLGQQLLDENQAAKIFQNDMAQLVANPVFSDMCFMVEREALRAHKVVRKRSKWYRRLMGLL